MKKLLDKSQKAHWKIYLLDRFPDAIEETVEFDGNLILFKKIGDDMEDLTFRVLHITAIPDEKFFIEL